MTEVRGGDFDADLFPGSSLTSSPSTSGERMTTQTGPIQGSAPTPELFKLAAGHWASGVAIITAADPSGQLVGLTMSAVTSLSLDPMQFLIAVDKRSASLPAIRDSGLFCINFLSAGQRDVAMRFAGKSANKFEGVEHRFLANGLPVIDGNLVTLGCRVAQILHGGDHDIVIGDVEHVDVQGGEPMVHFRGSFRALA